MNLQTRAVAYGITGVVLAGAVILAGANLGAVTPAASGILSVMLTDPSTVPKGTTAVYITYDNLGLHASGLGEGGWVALGGQGTLETLGLANFSQTISSANVPTLNYDQIAFEISAATVEFHGVNYSAAVSSGRLVAAIPGGLAITPTKAAAVVMDILPTVLNLGDRAVPKLVISAELKALPVPSDQVSSSMTVLQNRVPLAGQQWSRTLADYRSGNITISGISIASNAFSFQATNRGSQTVDLRMVVVTPVALGATASAATGALSNSFVFYVEPDGTLQILRTDDSGVPQSALRNPGYSLAPGATFHFSYSGAIATVAQGLPVSKGVSYYLFVVGQPLPSQAVQAD